MSVIVSMILESFFKPETKKRGQQLYDKQLVTTTTPSDTEISGFAKGHRIRLRCQKVSSQKISAQCSCLKNMCFHIWAVLLKAQDQHPDFFDQKSEIEMDQLKTKNSQVKEDLKNRQKLLRQLQYQKLKKIQLQKKTKFTPVYPPEVEKALRYFSDNGFDFAHPMDIQMIQASKKKLARVFHPDRGGSHEEIIQLNQNSEVLIQYLNSLS